MILEITKKEDFEKEVLKSDKPVLVDFWGPQCAPCKLLTPEIEKIADEFEESLKVVKIDASKNRRLCLELKVLGLPAVVFFKNGQEIIRLYTYNANKVKIREELKKLLGE